MIDDVMITDDQIQQSATEITAAQTAVQQINLFSARFPDFDLESAYAVAHLQQV